MKIAKNIPRIIYEKERRAESYLHEIRINKKSSDDPGEPKDYTLALWIGIFANAVFPLGELIFNV